MYPNLQQLTFCCLLVICCFESNAIADSVLQCHDLTATCECYEGEIPESFDIQCTKQIDIDITNLQDYNWDPTFGIQVVYLPKTILKIECLAPSDTTTAAEDPLLLLAELHLHPAEKLILNNCNLSDFIIGKNDTIDLSTLLMNMTPKMLRLSHAIFPNGRIELPDLHNNTELLEAMEFVAVESSNLLEIPHALLSKMGKLSSLQLIQNNLRNVTGPFSEHLLELNLANNEITHIHPNAFHGLRKLRVLELWGNRIAHLDAGVFSHLNSLVVLELMSNVLQTLSAELFASLEQLEHINLSMNEIDMIPGNLFENNSKLLGVRLSNNRLVTIPKETFRSLSNLMKLDLEHNAIKIIDKDVFSFNGNLVKLDLSFNRIRDLPKSVFEHQTKLTHLFMTNNEIVIDEIDETTPLNFLVNVEVLDLSFNQIDFIPQDIVMTMGQLKELHLRNNAFKTLDFSQLQTTSSQLLIDLSFNQIHTLEMMDFMEEVFRADMLDEEWRKDVQNSKIVVKIAGNPIKCDCNNYDLYRYRNNEFDDAFVRAYDIKMEDLNCAAPEHLRDVDFIKASNPEYLHLTSTCPENCDCYHQPRDNGIIIDCQGKNLTTIPRMFMPMIKNPMSAHCNDSVKEVAIQIILKDNFIHSIDMDSFANLNVTMLDISFNNLTVIERVPQHLKCLHLDHNNLKRLNWSILQHLENVTLDHNPWMCDCGVLPLWNYLGAHVVPNKSDIRCYSTNQSIPLLTREKLCPSNEKLIISSIIITSAVIIMAAITIALYYKYNQEIKVFLFSHNLCLWFVNEEDLDKDKIYDAFISFSQHDEQFILQELLPKLENPANPFKVCIHMRDWIAGEFIAKQVMDSVQNSRRTIVILSPSFLESIWAKMEFRAAHLKALSDGVTRVIVIIYGDLDPNDERIDEELRFYLKTNTYIRWGDAWFWDKLWYALPHRKSVNNLAIATSNPQQPKANPLEFKSANEISFRTLEVV